MSETIDTVRELLTAPGPVCSVYVRTGAGAQGENALRHRGAVEALARQGADAETLQTVERSLAAVTEEPGVEAVFVSGGRLLGRFPLPGEVTPEQAVYGTVPRVLPVLRWLQERPAHVAVLIDRTGADLVCRRAGERTAQLRTVIGPDDEIERNAPGGWAQMRYQHRAEDSWQHNAATVARQVADELGRCAASLLLVRGDVRAVQYLEQYLPAGVRRGVHIVHLPGGRGHGESGQQRDARMAEAVRDAVEAQIDLLLTQVADGLGPGGLAVDGVQATIEALAGLRVRTLLVTDDPRDDRILWVGLGAADIRAPRDPQPSPWPWTGQASLADAAARSALLAGADVRVLTPGHKRAPAEGVGALCRFD